MQAHAPKLQHAQQQLQQHQALDGQEQCPDDALFKTRMCLYYNQGRCQRGSACTFAHDPSELQAYNPARRYTQQVHLPCTVCTLLVMSVSGSQCFLDKRHKQLSVD